MCGISCTLMLNFILAINWLVHVLLKGSEMLDVMHSKKYSHDCTQLVDTCIVGRVGAAGRPAEIHSFVIEVIPCSD